MTNEVFNQILQKLSEPFPIKHHSYKPIAITKNGAWVAYYIDLRRMVERLQSVLGGHFSWHIYPVGEGGDKGYNVRATLNVYLSEDCVFTVEDMGYAPAEATEGFKSATTDALRRVLSHLGIGRYLYFLPRVFIRGERTDGGFRYEVDPLKVLSELLENPTDAEVVFYPQGAYDRSEASDKKALSNNEKRWMKALSVEEEDDFIQMFRDAFSVRRLTDKQIKAFMRLVEPDTEILEALTNDGDNYIKQTLDERLGSK